MSDLIAKFSKISLADISKSDSSKFPELSAEQKALASQFETLAKRLDEPESLIALNDSLRTKTFIVGNIPSHSDLVVFEKVFSLASQWTSKNDIAKYRHILRWVDLVQNTLVSVPEPIKIDYDIDIPREVKEKKKPAKEAEKSATPEPKAKATPDAAQGQRKELTEEEKKAKAAAKEAKKAAKAKANAEKNKQPQQAAVATPPNPSMIDFRVGFIEKAEKHPNADSLYMSTIDMGDAEGPRIVCSGLVKYIPIEEMQKRYVVVVANLKPVTMRGVKSCAMVLCASDAEKVEFVNPPAGSKPGDKIFFEGYNGTPEKQLNPKKKIWEAVQPHFSTNENYEVTYTEEGKEPKRLVNEKGELCKNSSIVKADVK
ncbi:amino acyl-tRNA synthetase complex component, putative [Candida dubliniensis CD36]|uniref:Amino acyl-tRNA synthetase complex component, putative n=1 Tax=Candida dubliniensis (strain CD36 / ATCC MYA-646 / CBS 7987 / NCPF 3949 / NRRL Y-17841) TaxID=573826 RepID=B9WLA8_CANDC|nr:amino acyl-tRNA synthetase complex component, putative [Candida dubliniensis CD36]CAX39813.1 amino acyl-tRNA synthetase complex component, putative [Candida dubliniensis CD36]